MTPRAHKGCLDARFGRRCTYLVHRRQSPAACGRWVLGREAELARPSGRVAGPGGDGSRCESMTTVLIPRRRTRAKVGERNEALAATPQSSGRGDAFGR